MNIPKQKIKLVFVLTLVSLLAYAMVFWGNEEINNIIDSLSIQILAILVGLIIGAVAILMTLLGNLINGVIISIDRNENIDLESLRSWINNCNSMIDEMRQNVLFLIFALFACALFSVLKNVDAPYLEWPFYSEYFNKELIMNSVSLAFLGCSFLAILDVVNTMFIINRHNEILLISKIAQSE